jgi:hypothetical protein
MNYNLRDLEGSSHSIILVDTIPAVPMSDCGKPRYALSRIAGVPRHKLSTSRVRG